MINIKFLSVLIVSIACNLQAGTIGNPPTSPDAHISMSTYTIHTLYTGDRFRDPFSPSSKSAATYSAQESDGPAVADIHALQLRGIMKDSNSEFAIFVNDTGASYMLRYGKLYDSRNKVVAGVTGHIRLPQKRAELITGDKDVQIYSLGENNDEDSEKAKVSALESASGRTP